MKVQTGIITADIMSAALYGRRERDRFLSHRRLNGLFLNAPSFWELAGSSIVVEC
jgi:hypothetical protein